jgi:hypothetical protein
MITNAINKLNKYIINNNFKGYDPYDALTSPVFKKIKNPMIGAIITQIFKKNPINLRSLFAIKPQDIPKGLGLMLKAFSLQYMITKDQSFKDICNKIYLRLIALKSPDFPEYCWGCNFPWSNPNEYLPAYCPSVVVTSFVVEGLATYKKIFHQDDQEDIDKIILSASNYVMNRIPHFYMPEGIVIAYTHNSKSICYNSSLLAMQILLRAYEINQDKILIETSEKAVNYVVSKQHSDGHWNYSINPMTKEERVQVDFHQGFILDSLLDYFKKTDDYSILKSIKKGINFYKFIQFSPEGVSKWRYPKEYPIEIHNQAQGIITFSKLNEFLPDSLDFANIVAKWTIKNMQDKEGYFYYQKYPLIINKIPYMRWSQAWMLLALSTLDYYSHNLD